MRFSRARACGPCGLNHVPVPLNLLIPGAAVPVDVRNPQGQLLLRRGEWLVDEAHLLRLRAHKPCISMADARAWQRAYERAVQRQLRDCTLSHDELIKDHLPATIEPQDYAELPTQFLKGGWLDAQEVLRVLLFHGGLAMDPLPRLRMMEERAMQWLQKDADDSLLSLFQALATPSLGYCATHALLCMVITQLTAEKLGLTPPQRRALRLAALTMNIGIGRIQDAMALQTTPLSSAQREQVKARPQISFEILQGFGLDDPLVLDLVRWHHEPAHAQALADNHLPRLVLHLVNVLVAKMAARQTRSSLAPKNAERALYLAHQGRAAQPQATSANAAAESSDAALSLQVSAAMASAIGFFPPGSYVRLINGDTALCVRRGAQANTPWVVPIVDHNGMPYGHFTAYDASLTHGIAHAVNFEKVRVSLNLEKIRRARDRLAVAACV